MNFSFNFVFVYKKIVRCEPLNGFIILTIKFFLGQFVLDIAVVLYKFENNDIPGARKYDIDNAISIPYCWKNVQYFKFLHVHKKHL